ncbi:LysR family transcriptional regulator [Caulobacter sp. SLTY]|uniref:LysR family transcriptional regulator n=1 Tax=Caulobacter sp. SLTY TaxID=2683262 RepID=UPI00141201A5|nr:LysR family transcriptional regulator [Caulobacter sp. SLTY]NBB16818.1 LysR family transcriptional regulator [Caulobacter sp. SLTY]
MDRLAALRLFLRVAETGSFSRAAAELGIAQSAASRAVSGLEAELGGRLLNRTTRSLALTDAGRKVCDHARAVAAEFEAMEQAVRGAEREPAGLLRVTASVALTRAELAPLAADFLRAHPRMRLDLAARDDRVDLVAEGIDLALRLGELEDSRLTAVFLGSYPRMVVAAPGFQATAPSDLAGLPAISLTSSAFPTRWPLTDGRAKVEVEINPAVRTANGDVLADLARSGLGAILAPGFLVAADLEAGRLVRVLPDWSGPPLSLWAVWHGRTLPRKARAFLDFLGGRLAVS